MKRIWWIGVLLFWGLFLSGCNLFTEEEVEEPDELTVQLQAIYDKAIAADAFEGTYEEWLESVRGPQGIPGADGREIVLRIAEGHIQWQYVNEEDWANLVELASLVGPKGEDGTDGEYGREITFRVSDDHIQWQYVGDEEWIDLIELASLVGPTGDTGDDGKDGVGIADAYVDGEGNLIIELSDGTSVDAGEVGGADGAPGEKGPAGLSAYALYQKYYPDYEGTEADWLDDLIEGRLGEPKTHTVSFVAVDGNEFDDIENIPHNTTIDLPIPKKDGHEFLGWYFGESINDKQFTNSTRVTEDANLHARFRPVDLEVIYTIRDGEVTVLGFSGSERQRDIPATIEGFPVTALGAGIPLFGVQMLESVTIPSSVTTISSKAFSGALFLEEVVFAGDSQLETIHMEAFESCLSLSSIHIPSSVTWIGVGAFRHAETLESVTFEDGSQLETLETDVFNQAYSLMEILIPASVQYIWGSVFLGNDDIIIYAEALEEPPGWNIGWNVHDRPVVWGVTGKHTIYFETSGGSSVPPITAYNNTPIAWLVADPEKEGYTFAGWYADEDPTVPIDHVPQKDATLHAKWEEALEAPSFAMVFVGEPGIFFTIPTGTDDEDTAEVESGYWMATTQTTYELWYAVRIWAEANGYHFQNPGQEGSQGTIGAAPTDANQEPVTRVSWRDVIVWLNALSEMQGYDPVYRCGDDTIIKDAREENAEVVDGAIQTANNGYRLPTCGEWEMAARWKDDTESTDGSILVGGRWWTPGNYASGATANHTDASATELVAWYRGNAGMATHPVGQLTPNHLGIYDMSGNAWDWTYTTGGSVQNLRGGWYNGQSSELQTGHVISYVPSADFSSLSFRIVKNP